MAGQTVHLICAECGTFSEDDAEGWRAYTAGGLKNDQEDPDPFVVSFCPKCQARVRLTGYQCYGGPLAETSPSS